MDLVDERATSWPVITAVSISSPVADVRVRKIPRKGRASRTPKALTSGHVFWRIVKSAITLDDFKALDIRVGTVREASPAPAARTPALRLKIDFGGLGVLNSSAQLTDHYRPENLVGRQVLAVVNLPTKQIGKYKSQVLVLGAYESGGAVRLLAPDRPISNGTRLK